MSDTGLTEEYLHRLLQEKNTRSEKLSNGHAKDYPSYREGVGYIRGIEESQRILHEVIKHYTQLQDDFDD